LNQSLLEQSWNNLNESTKQNIYTELQCFDFTSCYNQLRVTSSAMTHRQLVIYSIGSCVVFYQILMMIFTAFYLTGLNAKIETIRQISGPLQQHMQEHHDKNVLEPIALQVR